jgi:hypothetical protein
MDGFGKTVSILASVVWLRGLYRFRGGHDDRWEEPFAAGGRSWCTDLLAGELAQLLLQAGAAFQ